MEETVDDFFDVESDNENICESLLEQFACATKHVETLVTTSKLDSNTLLTFYGLYKQSTEGKCNKQRPSWYEIQAKSKWDAWNNLGEMSKSEAMQRYINHVKGIDANFNPANNKNKMSRGWVNVSSMINTDVVLLETDKGIFDHVKEGNIEKVKEYLDNVLKTQSEYNVKTMLNSLDNEGLGLIHWAADRGNLETLKTLLMYNADPNLTDAEGQTSLHYASSCGHLDCIKLLLDNGANQNIKDNDNLLAKDVAADALIKTTLESWN